MKKIFFLMIMAVTLASCSNENSENDPVEINTNNEFSSQDFVGSTVAYKNNGQIKLGVSKSDLLKSFNKFARDKELNLSAISYEIIEIDDNFYLRFYNADDSVSTVALINSGRVSKSSANNELIHVGETVCTTTECANCCGCVPSGDYCTRCEVNVLSCKRTTSG